MRKKDLVLATVVDEDSGTAVYAQSEEDQCLLTTRSKKYTFVCIAPRHPKSEAHYFLRLDRALSDRADEINNG